MQESALDHESMGMVAWAWAWCVYMYTVHVHTYMYMYMYLSSVHPVIMADICFSTCTALTAKCEAREKKQWVLVTSTFASDATLCCVALIMADS